MIFAGVLCVINVCTHAQHCRLAQHYTTPAAVSANITCQEQQFGLSQHPQHMEQTSIFVADDAPVYDMPVSAINRPLASSLDEAKVQLFVQDMRAGAQFTPIEVAHVEGEIYRALRRRVRLSALYPPYSDMWRCACSQSMHVAWCHWPPPCKKAYQALSLAALPGRTLLEWTRVATGCTGLYVIICHTPPAHPTLCSCKPHSTARLLLMAGKQRLSKQCRHVKCLHESPFLLLPPPVCMHLTSCLLSTPAAASVALFICCRGRSKLLLCFWRLSPLGSSAAAGSAHHQSSAHKS